MLGRHAGNLEGGQSTRESAKLGPFWADREALMRI